MARNENERVADRENTQDRHKPTEKQKEDHGRTKMGVIRTFDGVIGTERDRTARGEGGKNKDCRSAAVIWFSSHPE